MRTIFIQPTAAAIIALIFFQSCGQKISTDNTTSVVAPSAPSAANFALVRAPEIRGTTSTKQYQLGGAVVDQNYVNAMKASANPAALQTQSVAGGSKSTAAGVKTWPGGVIQYYIDPQSGFTDKERAQLKQQFSMGCNAWKSVANINCTEITEPSTTTAFLRLTQSQVPLKFAGAQLLCAQTAMNNILSCATHGVQGIDNNYLALHKSALSSRWEVVRQIGTVLGLGYEHQRPGRDNYVLFKNGFDLSSAQNSHYQVISSLPAVNNDYDFASIMHSPTVNVRDPDFLSGKAVMAFKTSALFENNYMNHRASQLSMAGSVYPSTQDAQNLSALYGAPTAPGRACIMYNPKMTVPHGAQIGTYSTQAPSAKSAYCEVRQLPCADSDFLYTASQGYTTGSRTCPIRCTIAGEQVALGDSKIIYTIQAGTDAKCASSRKEVFCDLTNLGPDKATPGFLSCGSAAAAPVPPVTTNPPASAAPVPVKPPAVTPAPTLPPASTEAQPIKPPVNTPPPKPTAERKQIIDLYKSILERTELELSQDEAGIQFWVSKLKAGVSLTEVAKAFRASDEYFVRRLYKSELHRTGDTDGIRYHSSRLANKLISRDGLTLEFRKICTDHVGNECL